MSLSDDALKRLDAELRSAGIPIDGVGNTSPPRVDFRPEATAQQQADAAAIVAAFDGTGAEAANQRDTAKAQYDDLRAECRVLRALVLVLLDEVNALRGRDRDRATDVAGAGTLLALKTAWAARSALADRTPAQTRTAIRSAIDGDA